MTLNVETEPVEIITPEEAEDLLSNVLTSLPGVIACGLVNLRKGAFISLKTSGSHPKDFLAYLAETALAYFEGDSVQTIKAILDQHSPEKPYDRQIEEIIFRSSRFIHMMSRLTDDPMTVIAVVVARETKLGLIMNTVHSIAASYRVARGPTSKLTN